MFFEPVSGFNLIQLITIMSCFNETSYCGSGSGSYGGGSSYGGSGSLGLDAYKGYWTSPYKTYDECKDAYVKTEDIRTVNFKDNQTNTHVGYDIGRFRQFYATGERFPKFGL